MRRVVEGDANELGYRRFHPGVVAENNAGCFDPMRQPAGKHRRGMVEPVSEGGVGNRSEETGSDRAPERAAEHVRAGHDATSVPRHDGLDGDQRWARREAQAGPNRKGSARDLPHVRLKREQGEQDCADDQDSGADESSVTKSYPQVQAA